MTEHIPINCTLKWNWANLVKLYYKETDIDHRIPKGGARTMMFFEVEAFAEWLQKQGYLTKHIPIEEQNGSMERQASEAIKFCQDRKITSLKVKFIPKKGWTVNQKYCCPKHTPQEILIKEEVLTDKTSKPSAESET